MKGQNGRRGTVTRLKPRCRVYKRPSFRRGVTSTIRGYAYSKFRTPFLVIHRGSNLAYGLAREAEFSEVRLQYFTCLREPVIYAPTTPAVHNLVQLNVFHRASIVCPVFGLSGVFLSCQAYTSRRNLSHKAIDYTPSIMSSILYYSA